MNGIRTCFKWVAIFLAVSASVLFMQPAQKNAKVEAGAGCLWPTSASYLQASKTSAVADGSDVITITANSGCLLENGSWEYSNNDTLRITVSGSNNSVTPSQQNNNRTAINFALTSTNAEQKTVQMQYWAPIDLDHPDDYVWHSVGDTINVVFTNSTSTNNNQTSTPTTTRSQASTQTATATQQASKPSTPLAVAINNTNLPESKTSTQTIRVGEQLTFSGTAAANATVKLYIYSDDPISAETTADGDGNWSYTLTDQLAVGDHRVEAETVDADGNTSDRVEIAKFSVKEQITPVELNTNFTPNYLQITPLTLGMAALALILIVLFVYMIIRSRRNIKNTTTQDISSVQ